MKRKLLTGLLLLLSACAIALGWLLASESGLRWTLAQVAPRLPGELKMGTPGGRLVGPIVLIDIDYRQDSFRAAAARLELEWNPWALLRGDLELENIDIDSLALALPADEKPPAEAPSTPVPPEVVLPLSIRLGQLAIDGIELTRGEQTHAIDRLRLGAALLRDSIEIESARIETPQYAVGLAGSIRPTGRYSHGLDIDWHLRLPSGNDLAGRGSLRGDLEQTTLTQQVSGAAAADLRLRLAGLLAQPTWTAEIELADFDARRISADYPDLAGAASVAASGDLNSAAAHGNLRVDAGAPWPIAADFELTRISASPDYTAVEFEQLDLRTEDGRLRADGRVEWAPALAWSAAIRLSDLNPVRVAPQWPGRIDASIETSGNLADGVADAGFEIADLTGELRGYPLSLRGRLRWHEDAIDIAQLDLESGNTSVGVKGRIAEHLDLQWSIDSPNLGELYPAAGGNLVAGGQLFGPRDAPGISASFSGSALTLPGYAIEQLDGIARLDRLAPPAAERASGNLELKLAANRVRLRDYLLERIEISADNRRISARGDSIDGRFRVDLDGALVDSGWRGQLSAMTLEHPDFGSWALQRAADLSLSPRRTSLQRACLADGGQALICASIDAADDIWRIETDSSDIPLALLRPILPTDLQLNGVAGATARLSYGTAAQLRGEIRVDLPPGNMDYRLREDQVEQVDYRGGSIDIVIEQSGIRASSELALRDEETFRATIELPGARLPGLDPQAQAMRAEVSLNLVDLGIVEALIADIDNLHGAVEISARISGTPADPGIDGEARLSGVAFELPRLRHKVGQLNAEASSKGLQALDYRAEATVAGGRVDLTGRTALDPAGGWPSRIELRGQRLELARLLRGRLPAEMRAEGLLDASANLQLQLPDRLEGTLQLMAIDGRVTYPLLEGEIGQWTLSDASAQAILGEDGASADASVTIGENHMTTRLQLPQARILALDPGRQAVQAAIDLEFRDLALLASLVPEIQQPRGLLRARIDVGGTVAAPRIDGFAELGEASLQLPRLGLVLDRIEASATADETGELRFDADAAAGDGKLRLAGSSQLDPASGWPTVIRISGNDFPALRIPEATIDVTPDLEVRIEDRKIDIEGEVSVPLARLRPRDVTTAARVSNDTIVIGGDQPPARQWQITSKVRLILGERVSFYGFGFDSRLGGNLVVEEQPGQPTRGTGVINIVEGRYRAYGQYLDVENGRLLFAGGALSNPGLDIRAVRTTGDITAGIKVTGRLLQPEIDLFSIPAMGQTDTLSYLLTGGPLETATSEQGAMMANAALALRLTGGDRIARSLGDRFGFEDLRVESSSTGEQASLVIGRYLSPRLYVSYGVGLIESINTVNLRYRISPKWRIEAESGEAQGADFLYSIER